MWRYAPLMGVSEEHVGEMLRIGWTPLVKSHNLAKVLGLKELYIKVIIQRLKKFLIGNQKHLLKSWFV